MSESEKLKVCPFCGGEACILTSKLPIVLLDTDGEIGIREMFRAECKICGARTRKCINQMQAIAAWNKRAQDTEAKRRRTEQNPNPLTLDELQEMDGEPVWIEENGKTECGVVSLEGNCLEKEPVITLANGNFYLLKEYNGKTWLAYRTNPERSGK